VSAGAPSRPTIAAVIVTGGNRDVFDRCLAAVLADPGTSEAIVIFDSDAEPSSAGKGAGARLKRLEEMAKTEPRLRIAPMPPEGPDGLWRVQRARDHGARLADSEVILGLDDDVVLEPGVVSAHAAAHAEADDLVVIGYMPVATHHRWPRGDATVRYYGGSYESHCEFYEEHPDEILKALWGGNISVRRERWMTAVKRPRLQVWGHDDQELGLLFLREGMRGRFDRSLRGDHYYERTLAGFVERAEKSPAAQAKLFAANPDLLDPPAQPVGRRERVAAPLLALSGSEPGWRLVEGGLKGLTALAGALRLRGLGDSCANFLWFVTRERAVRRLAAEA
jgi:Glycosyltransferase like family 2